MGSDAGWLVIWLVQSGRRTGCRGWGFYFDFKAQKE